MFVATPGELYSNYEKLFLPFDRTTWILLIFTFSVAFGVIFVANRTSKRLQDLIFGQNGRTPSLNVIAISSGIGQTRLPTRNFSRFILMLFIIFCLIFRTAYQGVQFEMLTTQMRRPEIKEIGDLKTQNFTVFASIPMCRYKNVFELWIG